MILKDHLLLRKILMAGTGILLALFLLGHMLGNTTIFGFYGGINAYAHHIQGLGPLLWLIRLVMLAVLLIHVFFAIVLTLENRKAKPNRYQVRAYQRTDFAGRTMIYTGLIILAFLLYHLLHFTLGLTNPDLYHLQDSAGRHDVFSMVVRSFQNIFIALAYTIGLVALFFHLSHGAYSLFQTMGWNSDRFMPATEGFGKGLAVLLLVGFLLIPVSALLGLLA